MVTKWFGPYMLLTYLVKSVGADTIVRSRVILRGVLGVDVAGVVLSDEIVCSPDGFFNVDRVAIFDYFLGVDYLKEISFFVG